MAEASLKVTKALLVYPIGATVFMAMVALILKCFKSDFDNDISKYVVPMFKCMGYGLLAWFIFSHIKELEQVDVLTYFTFTLACFETADNFVNSFGTLIIALLKVLYQLYIIIFD